MEGRSTLQLYFGGLLDEVDGDGRGRGPRDGRRDLALAELRVLEYDLADTEPDGDVGQRRLAGFLAVDPDFRPGGGVDVGAAPRVERQPRHFAGLDLDVLGRHVSQVLVRQAQAMAPRRQQDLILARPERLAVLRHVDHERRGDGREAREEREIDRQRLAGVDAHGTFRRRAARAGQGDDMPPRADRVEGERRFTGGFPVDRALRPRGGGGDREAADFSGQGRRRSGRRLGLRRGGFADRFADRFQDGGAGRRVPLRDGKGGGDQDEARRDQLPGN